MSYFRCDLNKKLDIIEIDQLVGTPAFTPYSGGGEYAPYNRRVDLDHRDSINIRTYIETEGISLNYAKLTANNFMFKPITPGCVDINMDMCSNTGFSHDPWQNGLYAEVKEYDPTTGILLYRPAYNIWKNQPMYYLGDVMFFDNPWDIDQGSAGKSNYWLYSNRLSYSTGHICIVT